jgi:acetyl-CoA carboxylase carboxyl transferase subunit alpha
LKATFLDFEQPIAELETKIEELRYVQDDSAVDISEEIGRLDYINAIFTDFVELHGDRSYSDDPSIVGGLARFNDQPVMVIGHQKGRDTKEKIYRNFGMPRPEGYRKAMRLMRLAEKFGIPIITFIDTPGAYPGIGAEERGQSEAIGRSLYVMAELKVPVICTVIGEGGSGGALAISVGDQLMMMQYSTYSVISPEGCASILWKSAEKASEAAETLGITSARLKSFGIVDKIISEPLGGAHRDPEAAAQNLKKALQDAMRSLAAKSTAELIEERFEKLMGYGKYKEVAVR